MDNMSVLCNTGGHASIDISLGETALTQTPCALSRRITLLDTWYMQFRNTAVRGYSQVTLQHHFDHRFPPTSGKHVRYAGVLYTPGI